MDAVDHRARRDDLPPDDLPYPSLQEDSAAPRAVPGGTAVTTRLNGETTGYTLMVAGRRTGKTSFLRLLLDTSLVAQSVSRDQLVSVAKFVQGCSGHTTHVRTATIDIEAPTADADESRALNLTLIDTPSLDFEDEPSSQRAIADILRHVDARFAESVDDERKAVAGDHHVHLCIYFLDPDCIVPPSMSAPPVPLMPRARNGSLSASEPQPVILEPPVPTNPALCRPSLPAADIQTIKRLSARVNVLPVIARADMLTNDRLAAVKMAIRRDLAEAGIGFGIFDLDTFPQYPQYSQRDMMEFNPQKHRADTLNGYNNHVNGASSATASPSSTPLPPSFLRLPFALISPDIYSHSDGVTRPAPSRHELALQYTPSQQHPKAKILPLSKMTPGRFIRSYRWGFLDVMDSNHCDFVLLRGAIFHHMETLQKYTKEYLLQKFRAETQPVPSRSIPSHGLQPPALMQRMPLSHGTRPILAIETAPHPSINLKAPQTVSRSGISLTSDGPPPSAASSHPTGAPETSPRTATSSRSQRSRAKKITVACNFCRVRKLKCDGGRPACSQCSKRSTPCDYMTGHKRRGNGKARKQFGGSESEGESAEDQSGDVENPSESPEVISQPHSRRNSNVSMLLTETLPSLGSALERREEPTSATLAPIAHATSSRLAGVLAEARQDLPPIAALSVPPSSASREEAAAMPSIKQEDSQMTQRRRNASTPSGKARTAGNGSKIVACNICRARKTKCDGAHPTCGSCSRRSLPCNYVNGSQSGRSRGRSSGAATSGPSGSASARSSPSTQIHFNSPGDPPLTNGYTRRISAVDVNPAEQAEQPSKKMRVATEIGRSAIAVGHMP